MACKKNSFRDSQYGSFDNYNPYGAQLAAGSVLGTANALGASWPQTYSQTTGTAPNIQV